MNSIRLKILRGLRFASLSSRVLVLGSVVLTSFVLSGCGEEVATIEQMPATMPATAVGSASGSGKIKTYVWGKDRSAGPEDKLLDFAPKFSYAYPETKNGEKTLWLLVSDQSFESGVLDATDDRGEALRQWCKGKHAMYSSLQLDSHAQPMRAESCGGDGRVNVGMLSASSTMGDRGRVELKVNDGKRAEGSMATGLGTGSAKYDYYELTGDYQFAANVAPPSLRDRVLETGKEDASGVPGARAAFRKYWSAAGAAQSIAEIQPWFTPDRREQAAAQMAEMKDVAPGFEKMAFETLVEGHKQAPTIVSTKALGAAAVVISQSVSGNDTLDCKTLLLQLQGTWKIGKENCWVSQNKQ